jgi:hypothetical protein
LLDLSPLPLSEQVLGLAKDIKTLKRERDVVYKLLAVNDKEIAKLKLKIKGQPAQSTSSQKIAELETKSRTLEQKLLAESGRVVNLAREIETLKVKEQKANDLQRQKDQ